MSGINEAQPGSTWTPPQTPRTPGTPPKTPPKTPSSQTHVDRDSVGNTTAVSLADRYSVGNTTIVSLGHSDEDPKVLLGDLEENTDRTPLSTETHIRNLDKNTPRIPLNLIDRDHKDPRTNSSPATSTPGASPAGSSSSELKDSELQSSEESAIETSMLMVGEKKGVDIDDIIVIKMINTSPSGNSEDENESHEVEDTSWETIYDDTTLQENGARSCVAQRTRSHTDMRKLNLTQLMGVWSTSMEDSFVVIDHKAMDSLNLPRPEKAEKEWENKEDWCGKLKLLDTSLDKASRIGGPQRQVEMIKIYNKKTAEVARKNEELRQKNEGEVDSLEKEIKRVTFVVEEPAYTTAIQEVVKALETLVGMNLYTAPMRNIENIIKIILSICMDYSTQVQIVQETMESMAKLIRELLIQRSRMANLEIENGKLEEEKQAALKEAQDLTRYNDALKTFSSSLIGVEKNKGRDVVAEITECKAEISELEEIAKVREEKYACAYNRKEFYKTQTGDLGRKVTRLENDMKKERERS